MGLADRIRALAGIDADAGGPRLPPRPAWRRLTTLFVDIAGSTSLLVHHPAEAVLGVVQCFVQLVSEVAATHAGNVKDYEGDGALLYFESPGAAVRAALAIREALAAGHCDAACASGPGVMARMSLNVGGVVVGVIGSTRHRSMALVGPSVNIGSRLLKHVAPGGIIATGDIVDELRATEPELAARFSPLDAEYEVPGADGLVVSTYVAV